MMFAYADIRYSTCNTYIRMDRENKLRLHMVSINPELVTVVLSQPILPNDFRFTFE